MNERDDAFDKEPISINDCGFAARCEAASPPDVIAAWPPDVIAAWPPDVRQGYALPVALPFKSGLCPRFGLRPKVPGPKAEPGHSPN